MKANFSQARFLIVRLSSIGDLVHALPVAEHLKTAFPAAHITWLASSPAAELLEGAPYVDETIFWQRAPLDEAVHKKQLRTAWHLLGEAKKILRAHTFDVVLDVHGLFLTGLLSHFTAAPVRIGVPERHEGGNFFLTQMAEKAVSPHKIARYLAVLKPLGLTPHPTPPHLIIPKHYQNFAHLFFQHFVPARNKRCLFIAPKSSWPSKDWPLAYYAEALQDLPADIVLFFCGAEKDSIEITQIQRQLRNKHLALSLAGKLSLMELAALFQAAAKKGLLLASDSGPLHIAAAVNLPTLSLWGPTAPETFAPYNQNAKILRTSYACRNCHKTRCKKQGECMKAIHPAQVRAEILKLLGNSSHMQ